MDSLHLGHEIVARVAQVHRARFGKAPAPAPFTTCYRLDFARESCSQPGKIPELPSGYQPLLENCLALVAAALLPPSTDPTTMPLVSMRELLDHAAINGYGIPAFNVNNLEQVQRP